MKFSALGVFIALVLVLTACGGGDSGAIEIEDARYRLARADLGAGYLSITNSTDEAVTLEAASAEGVGLIELHESSQADDGTMVMEVRPNGFEIGAGETITLEPGGKHLMLFDPEGTNDLDLVLDFGDETIEVVAAFDEAASASLDDADHGDDHGADHGDEAMEDMDDDAMEDDEAMTDSEDS